MEYQYDEEKKYLHDFVETFASKIENQHCLEDLEKLIADEVQFALEELKNKVQAYTSIVVDIIKDGKSITKMKTNQVDFYEEKKIDKGFCIVLIRCSAFF